MAEPQNEFRRMNSDLSASGLSAEAQGGAVAIPLLAMEPSAAASAELRSMQDIVEACQEREGSQKLQVLLDSVSQDDRQYVFEKVAPFAAALMIHVFGNYVLQRVMHYGTPQQHDVLLQIIQNNLFELSQNTFGCRVVQKAFEVFSADAGVQITRRLQSRVQQLATDQHGNHVLQRSLEVVPQAAQLIVLELQNNLAGTSCQKYGCRVIQRLVAAAAADDRLIYDVVEELSFSLQKLVNDQFGNYVVQAIMRCGHERGLKPIYLLRGSYGILCRHKHASNVVETAYVSATPSLRAVLLQELLPHCVNLATDPFGNFVVQRIFEQSDRSQQQLMYAALSKEAAWLKTHMYGRSVVAVLQRYEKGEAPLPVRGSNASALPQSQYLPGPCLVPLTQPSSSGPGTVFPSASSHQPPLSPLTPVTPATPASVASEWSHNPNYGSFGDASVFQQLPPAVPQQQQQQQQHASRAPVLRHPAADVSDLCNDWATMIDDEPDEMSALYQGEAYGI
ncbi:Maternal protein pumilio [Diplonema papillatum]|nr:Maternal protein pumilio [Diplonema papillatum]